MKNFYFVLIATVLVLALSACSDSSPKDIDIDALENAMVKADNNSAVMSSINSINDGEDNFSFLAEDFDYKKVESYFFAYSSTGTAEEIAVIVLKNANDASEAKAALEAHVEKRIKLFSTYSPEQVKSAEEAKVFTSGNMAVLIMGGNGANIEEAFYDYIK